MTHQSNQLNPHDDAIDLLIEAHFHASPEELQPSSGFAQSVMQSIHAESVEPPPIAFPWRRILPGAAAILCSLLAIAVYLIRHGIPFTPATPAASTFHLADIAAAIASSSRDSALCWILVAACLAVAAIAASFHLTSRHE